MDLTAEQIQIAAQIDHAIKRIYSNGGDEVSVLQEMHVYMDGFKHLLDTTNASGMDQLIRRFDGFYEFAKILENLAEGIHAGEIEVPKDH